MMISSCKMNVLSQDGELPVSDCQNSVLPTHITMRYGPQIHEKCHLL